jgi:hypothetical protein
MPSAHWPRRSRARSQLIDAQVSGVTERPRTRDALRREHADLAAGPEPWTWLAERNGTAVGMLAADRPETARWIAPLARAGLAGAAPEAEPTRAFR